MKALVISLLVVFLSVGVFAQTSTSQISGTVRDSSGAVVPGVQVTATNEETGVAYRQQTTPAGLYAFPALPVGRYTVAADLKGFKTSRSTGNVLQIDTPLNLEITLQVGETSDVVNVEASAERLQTSNSTVGNVVSEKAIEELPLNGRNPLTLLVLERLRHSRQWLARPRLQRDHRRYRGQRVHGAQSGVESVSPHA